MDLSKLRKRYYLRRNSCLAAVLINPGTLQTGQVDLLGVAASSRSRWVGLTPGKAAGLGFD